MHSGRPLLEIPTTGRGKHNNIVPLDLYNIYILRRSSVCVYVRHRRFCTNNTAAHHHQSVYDTRPAAVAAFDWQSPGPERVVGRWWGTLPGNGTSYKINRFLVVVSALPAKA